ncbi:MAG TPA: hypothetical protein VFP26_14405 [Gemmatimonadaceae bacterium]|jgi:hypothetical protein|nr:hypothetical protein [Gemmatimonadaceae bacterium]
MTAPTTTEVRTDRLPPDIFRTIIAVLIALLTIAGWLNVFVKPPLRAALVFQTRAWWWIEQIISVLLAILCIGIIMRKRSLLTPAFWLTIYSLAFDIVRWYFEFRDGQPTVPVALILYLLFAWRLWVARRQVDAIEDRAVEATG